MPKVEPRHKNESFESLLRRWKNLVEDSEILKDARKYEAFERPGDKRKRAHAAAVKRESRRVQEQEWMRLGIRPPKPKKDEKKQKYRQQNTNGDKDQQKDL